jgi:methyl-accepting chemotaxis protein
MAKSNLQKVSVRTLPNGYSLKVDGKEYFYFNMMDLLAGFMVHIGLQEADYMENGNILTMLFQTMIGQEWEKNITAMRNRIKEMEEKLNKTLSHLEQTANTGDRMEPRICELEESVRFIADSVKEQKEINRKSLNDVREAQTIAKNTIKEAKNETNSLKTTVDIIKEGRNDIREMKEKATEIIKSLNKIQK